MALSAGWRPPSACAARTWPRCSRGCRSSVSCVDPPTRTSRPRVAFEPVRAHAARHPGRRQARVPRPRPSAHHGRAGGGRRGRRAVADEARDRPAPRDRALGPDRAGSAGHAVAPGAVRPASRSTGPSRRSVLVLGPWPDPGSSAERARGHLRQRRLQHRRHFGRAGRPLRGARHEPGPAQPDVAGQQSSGRRPEHADAQRRHAQGARHAEHRAHARGARGRAGPGRPGPGAAVRPLRGARERQGERAREDQRHVRRDDHARRRRRRRPPSAWPSATTSAGWPPSSAPR